MPNRHFITIDVGGTRARTALVHYPRGRPVEILRQKAEPTCRDGWLALTVQLCSLVKEVRAGTSHQIGGVGVALPGGINPHERTITIPAVVFKDAPREIGLSLDAMLRPIIGTTPIRVANDASLAALGEWHFAGHEHRSVQSLLYVTVSTGVGAGFVLNGKPFSGATGGALELGHVPIDMRSNAQPCGCGQHGCLEAYVSGTAISRKAWYLRQQYLGAPMGAALAAVAKADLTAAVVSRLAAEGDTLCRQVIIAAAETFGRALAGMLHLLNPQVVVLGGGVVLGSELFYLTAVEEMRRRVLHPSYLNCLSVSKAAKGDDAGLYGALLLAAGEDQPRPTPRD